MSSNSNRQLEWVEIIEPTSRNIMYANLTTGQCVWELPAALPFKKFDANQWWELFDSNTSRFYYYNATSAKTVWHRPHNSDIIPLAKLQQLKQNTEVNCGSDSGNIFAGSFISQDRRIHQPTSQAVVVSRRHKHPPYPPSQPSPSPSPRPSRRHHNDVHQRKRRASQSSQASSRSLRESYDYKQMQLSKQQSLDGVKAGVQIDNSLDRPRQLGLSRSHSFMNSPVGGRAFPEVSRNAQYCHTASGDSVEGLATPMMHRKHKYEGGRKNTDRVRQDEGSRPLRPSASAHTSLHHSNQYRASESDSSASPPTFRHKFSPLSSPHSSKFSPLNSPQRLPDSGTSTLATDCCSSHTSQHSLFDSGHLSVGSRGSDNTPSFRRKSGSGQKSETVSPTATTHSASSSRSKGSSRHRHYCPKHRHMSSQKQHSSTSITSNKTTTDSDTIQSTSSHHTNTSERSSPNNTSHSSANNSSHFTPKSSVRRAKETREEGTPPRVDRKPSGTETHQDLTHLYSNLDYVFEQPVYQYILEQAKLSGFRLSDRVSGERDSLHSDSDTADHNGDSDHFADDEAVSNADSSSQENLDEINYLADDETYTQFFTPPVTKQTSVSPYPSVSFSMKHPNVPVTSITFTTTTTTYSHSTAAVNCVTKTDGSDVKGIITNGGGVMGVGATSASIAESLSRISLGSASLNALKNAASTTVVATDVEGGSVMEKYAKENLNIHTRGLLRKRVPVIDMISWTSEVIRKPLLSTVDKSFKSSACNMFKLLQVYMSDRKAKVGMTLNSVALDIITMAHSISSLRDELYLQLCKQTTDNQKKDSLRRGWELMAIALQFFPPSEKLCPHLASYIVKHTDPAYTSMFPDVNKWPIHIQIAHYAGVCQKRLNRSSNRPATRKPCPVELDLAKLHIFRASMFGSTLQEVMQLQRDRYPHRRLPWVQTALSEEVLRLQGTNTEGIFRVPADNEEVQQIKQQVEQWEVGECGDAHVAAAVLKLWYRELHEPLIPNELYAAAIEAHDSPSAALELLHHLPHTNRLVLAYLVRFLQYFAQSEIVVSTKMDASNLAMVIAPNCLRCTSEDPVVIYQNTTKEMAFMKLLIHNLDTTFMEGVV